MNDVDWMMESDERKPNRVKMKDEADRCVLRSEFIRHTHHWLSEYG